jgi:FkbM family methyltransferase
MTGLRHRLIGSFARLRGWYPVKIGSRIYRCDPDNYWFWSKINRGEWEPHTLSILQDQLDSSVRYCDIGAWIGPTVLPAASSCARVYCFEPDRLAFRYLLLNLQRNGMNNVLPFNLALSAEDRTRSMASPRGKSGDSMTSLLTPGGRNGQEVLCLSWQTWLSCLAEPDLDFIKMDIEGGEYALLPAMAEYLVSNKPRLYLSLHPHLLEPELRSTRMSEVVEIVSHYRHFIDEGGIRQPINRLLTEQCVQNSGTYLFIP